MWLAGGCSISVILAGAVFGFAFWAAFNITSKITSGCLPSDFPKYPGAIWGGSSFGDTACRLTLLTIDDSSHIVDFYDSRLGADKWTVTSLDRTIDRIDFKHVSGSAITGIVWLVDRRVFRAICIEIDKSAAAGGARLFAQTQGVLTATRQGVCDGGIPQAPVPA